MSWEVTAGISLERVTGYKTHPCDVCDEWSELPDGDMEYFVIVAPLAHPYGSGRLVSEKHIGLCRACLRALAAEIAAALAPPVVRCAGENAEHEPGCVFAPSRFDADLQRALSMLGIGGA